MTAILKHISRNMVAGIVALLPIGGIVLAVTYLESILATSWNGIPALRPYYFPGLAILAALFVIYLVGLAVSSFLGRWLWRVVDRLLDRLPLLGSLYQTLKQILGYGEGEDAVFQRVVFVKSRETDAEELGLVTNATSGGRLILFVPGSPNPGAGRLLLTEASATRPAKMSVHDALTTLVAVGKTDLVR